MDYDPIKDRLGRMAARSPLLRRLFYRGLDTIFLRAWYVHRAARQILRDIDRDRVEVLDAGTGFGQYAYRLLRHDTRVHVTAVDVKEDYLADVERFFEEVGLSDRATLREHDLTLPLPESDVFDLILAVDVMEHIEDDEAVLRHLAASLRPGGHLIVNTPSDQGGSDADGDGESFIGEHVRDGYSPAEMVRKLQAAGLLVRSCTYTYGRHGSAAWRLLVQRPMQVLDRSWLLAPLLVPYYAIAGPVGVALNAADVRAAKSAGTGLLAVARRPGKPS